MQRALEDRRHRGFAPIRPVGLCLLVAVLAALVAACSGGGNTTSDQALTVGLGADGYSAAGPGAIVGVGTNVNETLISLTPAYGLQPQLATSWELRPPNTWRFHLRHGVMFHDKQPLNAQAVKVGLFDRVAKPEFGGTSIDAGPESAVVVDDYTIDFTPTKLNLHVPQQIAEPIFGVIAPGSDPAKPVGTGPFRFVEYAPQERLVVERNNDYWGQKARSSRITFRSTPTSRLSVWPLNRGRRRWQPWYASWMSRN